MQGFKVATICNDAVDEEHTVSVSGTADPTSYSELDKLVVWCKEVSFTKHGNPSVKTTKSGGFPPRTLDVRDFTMVPPAHPVGLLDGLKNLEILQSSYEKDH